MAERVVVVDHGRIIADDTSQRLKESLGDRVTLGFGTHDHAVQAANRAQDSDLVTGVGNVVHEVTVRRADGPGFAAQLIRDLDRTGVTVSSRRGRPPHPRRRLPTAHRPQPARGRSRQHRRQHGQRGGSSMSTVTPQIATDTWTVFSREVKPLARDPFQVVFSMIQPLVFLGLFAPLLPDTGSGSALQWFVPGIVAMSCLMGTSMVGSNLLLEMQTGSHERLLVAPLTRSSLLLGRAFKEIVPMLAQSAIILIVVTPFSYDLHLGGTLVGIVILGVFCVGVSSLSYSLALACQGRDWMFWAVQQTLLFPVLLLAGMLLPVDDGPGWLKFASQLNPLTHVVDAERALFAGAFPDVDGAGRSRRGGPGRPRRALDGRAVDEQVQLNDCPTGCPRSLHATSGTSDFCHAVSPGRRHLSRASTASMTSTPWLATRVTGLRRAARMSQSRILPLFPSCIRRVRASSQTSGPVQPIWLPRSRNATRSPDRGWNTATPRGARRPPTLDRSWRTASSSPAAIG